MKQKVIHTEKKAAALRSKIRFCGQRPLFNLLHRGLSISCGKESFLNEPFRFLVHHFTLMRKERI